MVEYSCGTSRRGISEDWTNTLVVNASVAFHAGCITAEFIPVSAIPPMSVKESLKVGVLGVCRCGTAYMCSSDC